jgi:hypothetical protein
MMMEEWEEHRRNSGCDISVHSTSSFSPRPFLFFFNYTNVRSKSVSRFNDVNLHSIYLAKLLKKTLIFLTILVSSIVVS